METIKNDEHVRDLENREAVDKIKELAEDTKICMFITNLNESPFSVRPMATQEVEDDGTFWFFSGADSNKNKEIDLDDRVQLIYSNNSSAEFLSVYGKVEIVRDKAKAKKLWNVFLTTWFHDGPDDSNLTLLRFTPEEGYYWDTKHNKMLNSIKIAIGAIKGKMMDDGIEGKFEIADNRSQF